VITALVLVVLLVAILVLEIIYNRRGHE